MFGWKKNLNFAIEPEKKSAVKDLLRLKTRIAGLYELETDPATHAAWRWSHGPQTELKIAASGTEVTLKFSISAKAPITVKVEVNGAVVFEERFSSEQEKISASLKIPPSLKPTEVKFRYSSWNERGQEYPGDDRQMAVAFSSLKVGPAAYFGTKICPHPFSQMDIPAYGPFVPCCYTWLTDEYYDIEPREYYANLHGKHDAWTGPGATALRKAVLAGDYKYCRREICQAPLYTLDEMEDLREKKADLYPPISEANLEAMIAGKEILADGPAYASITGDPRCNLACPSCRKEKITKLTPYAEGLLKKTDESLQRFASTIEVMKMSADGEVFFSPYLRDLLKSAGDKMKFPRLREVDLITNGLLFNQKSFEELKPGSELIRRVAVSVDAGTKDVYAVVRGGNWERLWENLHWVGAKRASGDFKDFTLRFVVRKANFRTMLDFVQLAESVGADCVDFSQFVMWNGMAVEDFEEEAVHLPTHQNAAELDEIRAKLKNIYSLRIGLNF